MTEIPQDYLDLAWDKARRHLKIRLFPITLPSGTRDSSDEENVWCEDVSKVETFNKELLASMAEKAPSEKTKQGLLLLLEQIPDMAKEIIREIDAYTRIKAETKSITIYPSKSEFIIEIKIRGESIALKDSELMSPRKFVLEYLKKFYEILPISEEWNEIRNFWLHNEELKREIKEQEDWTAEEEIRDDVIRFFRNCIPVKDLKDTLNSLNYVYMTDGIVYVPSKTVNKVTKMAERELTSSRIHFILKDLLVGKTKLEKIDEKPFRFWRFKSGSIGMKNAVSIDLTGEGEDEFGH
jgi:hypothetical protein